MTTLLQYITTPMTVTAWFAQVANVVVILPLKLASIVIHFQHPAVNTLRLKVA